MAVKQKIPCPRCDAKGWIPRYFYNRKGICFLCWGEKYIYVKVPEGKDVEELERELQEKEKARLEAHPPKVPMPDDFKHDGIDLTEERQAYQGSEEENTSTQARTFEEILAATETQQERTERAVESLLGRSLTTEPSAIQSRVSEAGSEENPSQTLFNDSITPQDEVIQSVIAPKEEDQRQIEELTRQLEEMRQQLNQQNENVNISEVHTEKGTKVKTQFKVMEADQLITSHTDSGSQNPAYPEELQPRDRSRATSEAQVESISNNLDPELLADSKKASDGAPIIGSDGVVESGNGRTMGIRRAYQKGNQAAIEYKQYLMDHASEFGLDANEIANMQNPILVRERLDDVDRKQFTREANESGVSSMSMGEQAQVDAEKLTPFVLDQYEGGDFRKEENAAFVQAFYANVVGQQDAGRFWTEGRENVPLLSDEGESRIRNALFAKAYSDSGLVNKLAEARDDSNVKLALEALVDASGQYARLREGMIRGDLYDLDISQELTRAIRKADELRRTNQKVDDYLNQLSMFNDELNEDEKLLLRFLDRNKRNKANIVEFLEHYIQGVENEGRPDQISLFGISTPDKHEKIVQAISKTPNGEEILQELGENERQQTPLEMIQEGLELIERENENPSVDVGDFVSDQNLDQSSEFEETTISEMNPVEWTIERISNDERVSDEDLKSMSEDDLRPSLSISQTTAK